MPLALVLGTDGGTARSPADYIIQLKDRLQQSYSHVTKMLQTKQALQRQLYNQKVHGEPYQPGNLLWLHSTVCKGHEGKKLHHLWTGPYEIVKKGWQRLPIGFRTLRDVENVKWYISTV